MEIRKKELVMKSRERIFPSNGLPVTFIGFQVMFALFLLNFTLYDTSPW